MIDWNRCVAVEDPHYVESRNSLIDVASKIANIQAGPLIGRLMPDDAYCNRWNAAYLKAMDDLAKSYRLVPND